MRCATSINPRTLWPIVSPAPTTAQYLFNRPPLGHDGLNEERGDRDRSRGDFATAKPPRPHAHALGHLRCWLPEPLRSRYKPAQPLNRDRTARSAVCLPAAPQRVLSSTLIFNFEKGSNWLEISAGLASVCQAKTSRSLRQHFLAIASLGCEDCSVWFDIMCCKIRRLASPHALLVGQTGSRLAPLHQFSQIRWCISSP